MIQFAAIYWNPSPDIFVIPGLDLPLRWYSIFFTFGFFLAYHLVHHQVLKQHVLFDQSQLQIQSSKNRVWETQISAFNATISQEQTLGQQLQKRAHIEQQHPQIFYPIEALLNQFLDQLLWYIVIGTMIGARLGHVFFYDWDHFKDHLVEICKIWHGGLASHGGVVGVVLSTLLCFYVQRKKVPFLSFAKLADAIALAAPMTACCIRIGNFFNQEILGLTTDVPWGVIFGSPLDGSQPISRHPVQLYEAVGYLLIFFFLRWAQKCDKKYVPPGSILALLLVTLFAFRCAIEFYKTPQENFALFLPWLRMGQLLSVPFIVAGVVLFWQMRKKAKKDISQNS